MSAEAVLNDLLAAGIRPKLTPDRAGIVVPKGAITPDQKVAILANKAELIRLLSEDSSKVAAVVNKGTRYAARVDRFMKIGLSGGDAEELAQRLAWRDQDFDSRTSCAECQHLNGRPGAWRCGNWQRADVGGPAIPSVFVAQMLQHCRGFKEGIK